MLVIVILIKTDEEKWAKYLVHASLLIRWIWVDVLLGIPLASNCIFVFVHIGKTTLAQGSIHRLGRS